jgi:Na+/H+-dicarboxylate symporter
MRARFLLAALACYGAAAVAGAAGHSGWFHLPFPSLLLLRWMGLASLAIYASLRRSLTAWILVGMAAGAELGYDWPASGARLEILSEIFLRLIKVIIAPLLFGTLVVGIGGHANLKKVGRMGLKAIVYFEAVTTIALVIGLVAINWSQAGVGVHLPALQAAHPLPPVHPSAHSFILHIFPENIARAVAEGYVLQVVVFSILFGLALGLVSEGKRRPMLAFAESLAETMFKLTNIVMLFAPAAVLGAVAYTVGAMGLGAVTALGRLLGVFLLALAAFILLVFLPIALLARVPLRRFLRALAEPVSIAFATTSSEAALPSAMEEMESFGVPRSIVAFVIPTGYSFNLDGTTLYLSLATIFVAQVAGMRLGLGQQLMILLTLLATSKGVAGVSRAALVVLLATASSFRLPLEPVYLLLGIDQLMDMARTSVNVMGNCLASVVVARWEGEFGEGTERPPRSGAERGARSERERIFRSIWRPRSKASE